MSVVLLAIVGNACSGERDQTLSASSDDRLILYTSLPAERVTTLADRYRSATGVRLDFLLAPDGALIEKLRGKEHIPSADVLLINGAGHLASAVEAGILRPMQGIDTAALDPHPVDPDGYWVTVGARVELVVYRRDAVAAEDIQGYADLSAPRWQGKLCLERGVADRSQALVAALIAAHGERETERIVRGWVANLAMRAFDEQQALLAAVDSGICAIAISSSEELARYLDRHPEAPLAVHAPGGTHGGTFENVRGVGVSRHANDPERARDFVDWLLSADGQRALHGQSYEFAVIQGVARPLVLENWAGYARSSIGVLRAGYSVPEAKRLTERARYR